MQIALNERERTEIIKILNRFALAHSAFIYGSRAKNTNRKFSDLDILFITPTEIPRKTIWELEEDFSESNLTFRVQIQQKSKISEDFYNMIKKDLVALSLALEMESAK